MLAVAVCVGCTLLSVLSCSKEDDSSDALDGYVDCKAMEMESSTTSKVSYVMVKKGYGKVYYKGQYINTSTFTNWWIALGEGYAYSKSTHTFFEYGGCHYLLYNSLSDLGDVYTTSSIVECIEKKCNEIYGGGSSGGGGTSQNKAVYKGKVTSYHQASTGSSYSTKPLYIYEYRGDLMASLVNQGETVSAVSSLHIVNSGADPWRLGCNKYIYITAVGWYYFKW